MTQLIWLTIALPLFGVLFNGILGRRLGRRVVSVVGPLVVFGSFLIGVGSLVELLATGEEAVIVPLWTWATIGSFTVNINLLVDHLSLLMVLVLVFMDIDPSILMQRPGAPGLEESLAQSRLESGDTLQLVLEEFLKIPMGLLIGCFVLYFVLGYLIYSSIYAAIGAAVDNETDTQQFIFPIILPLILGIYVGFFSVFSNPHGPIAVGFSIFPLTSPIVMLMRLPGGIGEGGVLLWQLLTSILLLALTFIGIVWLASKIYRTGILMYGKKPGYKELFKWLKY